MAMSTGSSREINVTPLIDVLLVLLIIFLVMMPIMLRTLKVDIPPEDPVAINPGIVVALKLDADLEVSLDEGPRFPNSELPARLRQPLANAQGVFVDFVDGVPWNQVVSTVDTVRGVANDVRRGDVSVAVRIRDATSVNR